MLYVDNTERRESGLSSHYATSNCKNDISTIAWPIFSCVKYNRNYAVRMAQINETCIVYTAQNLSDKMDWTISLGRTRIFVRVYKARHKYYRNVFGFPDKTI